MQSSITASDPLGPPTGTTARPVSRRDSRIVRSTRIVLALSGLLVTTINSPQTTGSPDLTYAVLASYTLYSIVIYAATLHNPRLHSIVAAWGPWLDVAWYTALIASSRATSSIFFFGYFFAVLVASFQGGFVPGLRVTAASAALFTIVALITASLDGAFELNRFLIRPVFLLVLGFMMAHWGGYEVASKRRLALLREVATLSNPRFGVDRTVSNLMDRLLLFYDAGACLLITAQPDGTAYRMRRARTGSPGGGLAAEEIAAPLGRLLLSLSPHHVVRYSARALPWERLQPHAGYAALDPVTGRYSSEGLDAAHRVAATLEAPHFISTPVALGRDVVGRVYLTASRHAFNEADADFLYQVFSQITPVLENVRLVDRLASEAAATERERIARDLHDSIIQPYIGLQIGLGALRDRYLAGRDVDAEIERLLDLTHSGVSELRGYVRGLKQGGKSEAMLITSLQRYAARFADATGIDVQVEAPPNLKVSDRLAAELFQIVSEGLSNIRRHTNADHAVVHLDQHGSSLHISIENPRAPGEPTATFVPRSLSERAAALGGAARVEQCTGGVTAVKIDVPL